MGAFDLRCMARVPPSACCKAVGVTDTLTIGDTVGATDSSWARGRGFLSVLAMAGVVVGSVAGMWAASLPGSSLLLVLLALAAWGVAGLAWVLLLGSRVVARPSKLARSSRWVLAVAPLLVVATAGLVVVDAPLRARWAMSERAFDRAVATVQTASRPDRPTALATRSRLGAYRVAEAYQLGDGVFFVVDGGGGILTVEGFAHLPNGPNRRLRSQYEGVSFRSLGDGWYAWDASV